MIKQPMDLSTVMAKLQSSQYCDALEARRDVKQTLHNCFIYHAPHPHDPVVHWCAPCPKTLRWMEGGLP